MYLIIELSLKTREVYQLWQRLLDDKRLFMEALLHKFRQVTRHGQMQTAEGYALYAQIKQDLHLLTEQLKEAIQRYEAMLADSPLKGKPIYHLAQFHPKILINNALALSLVSLVETYDQLIALLKLLRLIGSFPTDDDYYALIKRYQKMVNCLLSRLLLTTIKKQIVNQEDISL